MPECAFNHCLRGGASVLLQQPFFYRTTVDAHADHRAPRFGGIDHHFHDALILPGGAGSWVLRDTPEVIHLVKKMHEAGKLVAAICAAPIVLAKAGLVRDRNVTAYPAQDVYRELNEAGAHIVKDENVVLDGNMLTANGPGAAMLFGYSIGEYLGEDLQVAQLKEQMCYTGL